jgi:hypothetical protein
MQDALIVAAIGLNVVGIWLFVRMLRYYPAPALGPGSLRRTARRVLLPSSFRARWAVQIDELRQASALVDYLPYLLFVLFLWAPAPLAFAGIDTNSIHLGDFGSRSQSEAFLGTLWQVVAAAVGLSVAMIAFAFGAFLTSGQAQFGGSLAEFAIESKLLRAIRLGVLTLLMDGAVLLGIGVGAPGGWAGMWATLVSALTLLQVLVIVQGTVRSLNPSELLDIRRRHLQKVVRIALRRQLLSQVGDASWDRTVHSPSKFRISKAEA